MRDCLLFAVAGLSSLVVVEFDLTGQQAEPPTVAELRAMQGDQLFALRWAARSTAPLLDLSGKSAQQPKNLSEPFASCFADRLPVGTGDGLGPLHNATSCADCHPGGGAGGVEHNATLITVDPRSPAVKQPHAEHGRQLLETFPALLDRSGALVIQTVVHNQSTRPGYDQIRRRLEQFVDGGIDEAWFAPQRRTIAAIASQPVVAGRHEGVDFYLSQRNPPPLFGLGLIDRITATRLSDLAQEQARTGRVSGRLAGKFGWRGQTDSLHTFVAHACAGELGLAQRSFAQSGDPADPTYIAPGLDMDDAQVAKLARFVGTLPAPDEAPPEGCSAYDVYDGESIFNAIGCADCHVADVRPAFNVFSDLLLHDMGEALQDPGPAPSHHTTAHASFHVPRYRVEGLVTGESTTYGGTVRGMIPMAERIPRPESPQFPRGPRPTSAEQHASTTTKTEFLSWDALQREWRTPPLWGVANTAPYLHDGRAATLDEAILWHGGEALYSRQQFAELPSEKQRKLLAFLRSLKAPDEVARRQQGPQRLSKDKLTRR